MVSQHSGDGDGYDIVESDFFLGRVESTVGSVARWDEMREALDIWMLHNPTGLPVCRLIRDNLWFARIKTEPLLPLIYEVDERQRRVTYLDIDIIYPSISSLDSELDDLS